MADAGLQSPDAAAADGGCMDDPGCMFGRGYRQTITLDNSGGGELTDYQARLDIDSTHTDFWTDGHLLAGDDLRIRDDKGDDLPFWIQNLDTDADSATLWIKVSVPAGAIETLTLHYGDAALSSVSDIDATMIFGDDFGGGMLDTTKWNATQAVNFSQSGGQLRLSNTGTESTNSGRLLSDMTFSAPLVFESSYVTVDDAENGVMTGGFFIFSNNGYGVLAHEATDYVRDDGAHDNSGHSANADIGDEIRITIIADGADNVTTNRENWTDGETGASRTWQEVDTNTISNEFIALGQRYDNCCDNQDNDTRWNWLFVREYVKVGTEPGLTLNDDEVEPAGDGH